MPPTTPYRPPQEHNENELEDEDEYFLPLQDQRVFGAGIRRKRVPFVRSSEHELSTTNTTTTTSLVSSGSESTSAGKSIADRYLSIVLAGTPQPQPQSQTQRDSESQSQSQHTQPAPSTSPETKTEMCPICNLPIHSSTEERTTPHNHPHEATLSHQLSLPHSHPPSHLDRTRPGLRYLAAYGWDPDKRVGLGAPGREGIREPVKGKVKEDTVGLGAVVPDVKDKGMGKGRVEKKLNAKEVRKRQMAERRKGEKMREMFFRSEEVLKYFGEE